MITSNNAFHLAVLRLPSSVLVQRMRKSEDRKLAKTPVAVTTSTEIKWIPWFHYCFAYVTSHFKVFYLDDGILGGTVNNVHHSLSIVEKITGQLAL